MPTVDYRPGIISGANYLHVEDNSSISADSSYTTITTTGATTNGQWVTYPTTTSSGTIIPYGDPVITTSPPAGESYSTGVIQYVPYNVAPIYYPPTEEQLKLILAPVLAAQDKLIKELMDRLERLEKELAKLTTGRSLIIE